MSASLTTTNGPARSPSDQPGTPGRTRQTCIGEGELTVAYRPLDQALYVQLADTLRDRITSGALPPGSVLPSETELMTEYGISRPTGRAAFTALCNQGLITVIHGKGSFVRRLDTVATHTHPRTVTATPAPTPRARGGQRAPRRLPLSDGPTPTLPPTPDDGPWWTNRSALAPTPPPHWRCRS